MYMYYMTKSTIIVIIIVITVTRVFVEISCGPVGVWSGYRNVFRKQY